MLAEPKIKYNTKNIKKKVEFVNKSNSTKQSNASTLKENQKPNDKRVATGINLPINENKTQPDPLESENFKKEIGSIKAKAKKRKEHKSSEEGLKETENASELSTQIQKEKNNQLDHSEKISEVANQPKTPITAESFKQKFSLKLQELDDKIPSDKESAKKFKQEKPINKINNEIKSDIEQEQTKLVGPTKEEVKNSNTPTSNTPTKPVVELPSKTLPTKTKNISSDNVLPNKKTDEQISLEKDSAAIDEKLKENDISEETLEKSGDFTDTYFHKKNAQEKAAIFPSYYRDKENQELENSKTSANNYGKKAFSKMETSQNKGIQDVYDKQTTTQKDVKSKKKEIYDKLNSKYTKTKKDVDQKLKDLSEYVNNSFNDVVEKANSEFEKNVENKLESVYGWLGWKKIYKSDAVQNYEVKLVYKEEKTKFINSLNNAIDSLSTHTANQLNATLKIIDEGKKEIETYFNGLSEDEKKLGEEAFSDFQNKYKELEESVYETEDDLIDDLANTYSSAVKKLDETFEKLNEEAGKSLLDRAIEGVMGVIDTILKLKEAITNLLSAAKEAISVIMIDPFGFMSNLFSGIGKGFQNFFDRIDKHIVNGLIDWLTGSLGKSGITIPEDVFSLKGMFTLLLQIFGIGWDTIRSKAIEILGEPATLLLEKSLEIFLIIKTKGIVGIWEFIQNEFTDLKETFLDTIKDLVITKVFEAGIKWLLSLLIPGAGFIKAVLAIKDVIVFFVESAIVLIPAITQAILALAKGKIVMVAEAIEFGLAKIIPVLINLLMGILGIKGIVAKVQNTIEKIRKKVDKKIDAFLRKIRKQTKGLFEGKNKQKNNKQDTKQKDDKKNSNSDNIVGDKYSVKGGGESHSIFFENRGGTMKLIMRSTPKEMDEVLDIWLVENKDNQSVIKLINSAKTQLLKLNNEANTVNSELKKGKSDPNKLKSAESKDNELEKHEKIFSNIVESLLNSINKNGNAINAFIGKKVAEIKDGNIIISNKLFEKAVLHEKSLYRFDKNNTIYRKDSNKGKKIRINLEGILEEGETEKHTKFKPKNIKIEEINGSYIVKFTTESFSDKEQEMEINIQYEQIDEMSNDRVYSIDSNLKSGHLATGKRGKNDSANAYFDNAHIIGDQFGGSGYNESFNIKPSSQNYNRIIMKNVEDKIAGIIKKEDFDEKDFNMNVVAKLNEHVDNKDIKKLDKLFELEVKKDIDNKEAAKIIIDNNEALISKLRKNVLEDINSAPDQFLQVDYSVGIQIANNKDLFNEENLKKGKDGVVTKDKTIVASIGKDDKYIEAWNALFPNNQK